MTVYSRINLDSYYFTTKGFYLFYIPVKVPYQTIYAMADQAGLKKKEKYGPILENGKAFGFGWIGVEVDKPENKRADIKHIQGNYEVYEHKGPYSSLGKAYKKIQKDRPGSKRHYTLYLDDPNQVPAKDLRSHVLFR